MSPKDRITRRSVIKATVATAGGLALAGCSGGGGENTDAESGGDGGGDDGGDDGGNSGGGGTPSFDGYLDNVSNYDGVTDETGSSEVEVTVGTKANGANYGFSPAAVKVSTGTKVVWKWNGKGGSHNVIHEDGDFESELTDEEGFTFSQTFDSAGTYKYYCEPHKPLGMKGVVVVE